MDYIIGALAVYKVVHLLELALPRPVETWVKVAASVVLSYAAAVLLWTDHLPISGLVIATLASVIHAVVRLLTLAGDLAMRRTMR